MSKSYLTILEISKILEIGEVDFFTEFNEKSDEIKQHAAQEATFKIENLGIVNRSKKDGELTFPLPFQNGVLGYDLKICVALETLYIATGKMSPEIKLARMGVVAESNKSASATYDKEYIRSLKRCNFNNISAYQQIEKYIPKTFNMR